MRPVVVVSFDVSHVLYPIKFLKLYSIQTVSGKLPLHVEANNYKLSSLRKQDLFIWDSFSEDFRSFLKMKGPTLSMLTNHSPTLNLPATPISPDSP